MSLLIDKEMPSVCKKCKEQGKLAGGLYHVHTEDNFLNAYCDGDPSTGCPILCEIPDKHGDLKDVSILLHYLSLMHGATEHDNDLLREFEKMIRECPTVVEATE